MTTEARLDGGDAGLTRDGDGAVTIEAGDPVLTGVNVVAEEDWLSGTLESPRVADDGSRDARGGLSCLRGGREADRQRDRDADHSPPHPRDPTTPLRHRRHSTANGK